AGHREGSRIRSPAFVAEAYRLALGVELDLGIPEVRDRAALLDGQLSLRVQDAPGRVRVREGQALLRQGGQVPDGVPGHRDVTVWPLAGPVPAADGRLSCGIPPAACAQAVAGPGDAAQVSIVHAAGVRAVEPGQVLAAVHIYGRAIDVAYGHVRTVR